MTTGIYAIVNRETSDRYVGQSLNIEKRWAQHRRSLREGKASSPALLEAWNYFGEESFDFILLEVCAPEELDELEQRHMLEGSSLNHATPFVEPLKIERELGIDPNDFEIEVSLTESAISSTEDFRDVLVQMLRLSVQLEKLVESSEGFVLGSALEDDRLVSSLWEAISGNVYELSGGVPEILRRMDQLEL